MLSRWRRAASHLSALGSVAEKRTAMEACSSGRSFSKVSAAAAVAPLPPSPPSSPSNPLIAKPEARLNALFWLKPCPLALAPNSPLRIEEPQYEGFRRIMLKLLLFYSKQSKSIRGANVVYKRIVTQVDKPAIYDVFHLEKTFKTTFALLVLHMWLFLRRMKEEGKEGVEFGQYVYEIYNHDLELRVSKAGVNLLLTKWMKELERIFYGNIIAYDAALAPEVRNDQLANVLWKNVFSEDGSELSDAAAATAVQASDGKIHT
ncbi:ubiquinol-cytochrome-c reductase complex assembly factor 1-like [Iris pallida]|uniref:Ubiquinol-cytochrome-c reductase complex assembly factor 1-like n=1 Tax=Iris pallida TaxID=29817 RepID=A0AAX6G7N5_IRIPA|nr:ubiquinol-cytochrome-c reductase complex assembly factor 1-like [Iris pallida]KAJ6824680.1 ubiquinol-cytochrome-c reductase complex assembly factor 1-like [Iris pallida]